MLSPYFLNLIHGARMTIQPWTAWDFLPEMSENNTLKNTIRMQKFPFELLPYIYIYLLAWFKTYEFIYGASPVAEMLHMF